MNQKYIRFLMLPLLAVILPNIPARAQENNPYFTAWDSLYLNDRLPLMMPYNRIIDPAGTQVYFGDLALENHAMDCAISPDHRTVVILGRHELVFYNVESGRILQEFFPGMEDYFRGALNTYSGIQWYVKGGKQYVLWSLVCQRRSYVVMGEWDGMQAVISNHFQFLPDLPAPLALAN